MATIAQRKRIDYVFEWTNWNKQMVWKLEWDTHTHTGRESELEKSTKYYLHWLYYLCAIAYSVMLVEPQFEWLPTYVSCSSFAAFSSLQTNIELCRLIWINVKNTNCLSSSFFPLHCRRQSRIIWKRKKNNTMEFRTKQATSMKIEGRIKEQK